eukprot:GGOE01021220.1.p1 GENE.GGOE01021220.1~~GGOE01021220.1.p1  ORF type:complete len:354 (+),score=87.53 GGOE01021220.1:141-1202(+)
MASDTAAAAAVLERAKGYPYWRPSSSFIFIRDTAYTFSNAVWPGTSDLHRLVVKDGDRARSVADVLQQRGVPVAAVDPNERWTAVLAIGSNAGVTQLQRKFPADLFPAGTVIPVVQSVLLDFDVVYAPLVAPYGSVVATLQASPGSAVELFVTYLTDPQLERMHSTEGGYNLLRLNAIQLHVGQSLAERDAGLPPAVQLHSVLLYNHQVGSVCLPLRRSSPPSPVALAELKATARTFPALSQTALQRALSFLAPTIDDDDAAVEGPSVQRFDQDRVLALQEWFSKRPSAEGEAAWEETLVPDAKLCQAILQSVSEPNHRTRISKALEAHAAPLQHAEYQLLAALSDGLQPTVR